MAKYDPLKRYLARRKADQVELTFREIERIIGAMLPKGAQRSQWWSDDGGSPRPHVQATAWRDAGFRAVLVGDEQVRFER